MQQEYSEDTSQPPTIIQTQATTQLLIPKWIPKDEALYRWINLKDGVSPQRGSAKGCGVVTKGG